MKGIWEKGVARCGMGINGQTPQLAECQWNIAPMMPTWRKSTGQGSGGRRKDRRNTRRGIR